MVFEYMQFLKKGYGLIFDHPYLTDHVATLTLILMHIY